MSKEDLEETEMDSENRKEQGIRIYNGYIWEVGPSSPEFSRELKKLRRKRKIQIMLGYIWKYASYGFLIFLSSSFLVLYFKGDVRATCLQWIRALMDDGMTDYPTTSLDKDIEPAAGFTLGYVPDGYVLKSADMGELTGSVTYCKGTKQLIFHYISAKDANTMIDNENCTLSQLELADGTLCDLYKSNSGESDSRLIWQKKNYMCTLHMSISDEEEIIQIANGIKLQGS